ncbi:hypothetical protein PF66_06035 [Pseudomonas asplenii]|uniref:YD repeat-containing protein n=1 Tax=Pseudomonas asplenii TaxID=53407 RepID=A0A0N0E189_9PSED|nr:hypothetical protein PF66_06035 [Pseudomonas fuscovaginae]KPA97200.1 hypothetical protein PF70_02731 [Pseudomonas fuscovaginae]
MVLLVGKSLKTANTRQSISPLNGDYAMPTSARETLLCRYHYDPLDRLADSNQAQQSGLSAVYRRAGFTAAPNSRRALAPISNG